MAFVQGRHAPRRPRAATTPPAAAPPNPFDGGGRQAGPAPKDFSQPGPRSPVGGPPGLVTPAQPAGQGGFARPDTPIPLPGVGSGTEQPFGGQAGGIFRNPFAGDIQVQPAPQPGNSLQRQQFQPPDPRFGGGGLQMRQFHDFSPQTAGGLQRRQFANPFGQ